MAATVLLFAAPAAPAEPCAPAIGVICAGEAAMDEAAMLARLRAADIVILGERHDNPAHHERQARIVAALAPGGLAFEMVPRAREAAANAARASGDDLGAALDWAESGWPAWEMYAPIFAAAPGARIAGGGVERSALMAAVKDGAAAAFGDGAARYGLDEPLPEPMRAAMLDEQERAHCGALPAAMLPGMVAAQRLRDAAFADAALRLIEAGAAPAALITGNGHARTDRGAPVYLRRAAPELDVVSVGMIEIGAETEPHTPYDIAIFTAPFDRGDPCADFIRKRESDRAKP
ncbi:ChaN family lipoprotein [Pikeienuella sp. HZG-20]|uniref:ChaN family lipoprotein n=1 Tax=Paludibacillus litoralis TaxID=3133267 RepID=UPI0030EE176A